MRAVSFRLFQVIFSIALLAIAFWPWWGLAYKAVANIEAYPYIIAVLASIWLLLLGLNLPLSLKQFRSWGALCLLGLIATGLAYLYSKGWFTASSLDQVIIALIISVGLILGWYTIGSHIWRSYRGIYGIDDPDTGNDINE